MKTFFTSIILAAICSCAASQPSLTLVCYEPGDVTSHQVGCDSTVKPIQDADPYVNVAKQAMVPGNVILWAGHKDTPGVVERFPKMLEASRNYPGKFTYVYIIDEAYWDRDHIVIGQYDAEIVAASKLARDAGYKTLATILPDVILHRDFKLPDINVFDGISIDVYPSARPTVPDLGSCTSGLGNHEADLFYCSIQKLRSMGFRGQVGLVYQAFGITSESEQVLTDRLIKQRVLINNAANLGAIAIMPFGLYLGKWEIDLDPGLFPLAGTRFECLTRP